MLQVGINMFKHDKTLIDFKMYSYFVLFYFILGVDCITEHHKFEIVSRYRCVGDCFSCYS